LIAFLPKAQIVTKVGRAARRRCNAVVANLEKRRLAWVGRRISAALRRYLCHSAAPAPILMAFPLEIG
jgi:hypothetical protein